MEAGQGNGGLRTKARYDLDKRPDTTHGYSRRQLLKGLPLAIAGAVVFGVVSRAVTSTVRRRRQAAGLPEGSIFSPQIPPEDRS